MSVKKLFEYTFMKHLREILQEQLLVMLEPCPERGIKKKNDYKETPTVEYARSVFEKCGNLINTIDQLEYIPIFIKEFPLEKTYTENGINHQNYIQYHLENHYLKISSILDQSIILVSEIHNLGIPPKLTSLYQLKVNKHTKDIPSLKILKAFEKSIQGIKATRNKITHRGEFQDSELTELYINNFFNENNLQKNSKIELNDVINNKLEYLRKNNQEVIKLVNLLFESLDTEFKYKIKEIN